MIKNLVLCFVTIIIFLSSAFLAKAACPPGAGEGWTLICSGTNVCFDAPSQLYCSANGSRLTVTSLDAGAKCALHFPRPEAAAWCDGSQDADCDIIEPLGGSCEKYYGDPEDPNEEPRVPWSSEIDIPLPGEDPMDSETTMSEYINRVYGFTVLIAGILAATMLMIGGFQYLISAGNNAAVSEAKKTIVAALAGLIIVLGSYLLLRIINQELVDLAIPSAFNFPGEKTTVFLAILKEFSRGFIG